MQGVGGMQRAAQQEAEEAEARIHVLAETLCVVQQCLEVSRCLGRLESSLNGGAGLDEFLPAAQLLLEAVGCAWCVSTLQNDWMCR